MRELTGELTRLLLHLEQRAVNHAGLVDPGELTQADLERAEALRAAGWIHFGPLSGGRVGECTHYVVLTFNAHDAAAAARVAQAHRTMTPVVWDDAGQPHDGIGGGLVAPRDEINDDPIGAVRRAVSAMLRDFDVARDGHDLPLDHKTLTDATVDRLPDFFRQPLRGES